MEEPKDEPYAVTKDKDEPLDWNLEERDAWMDKNDNGELPDPTEVEVDEDG